MSNKPVIEERAIIAAAESSLDDFLSLITSAIKDMIGGEITAEWLAKLNADQVTLLAYDVLREEVMDGGFVQLVHNGYGGFIFFNPSARARKGWGLDGLAKLLRKCFKPFRAHQQEIEADCTDDEFMAMFERFSEFDDFDDDFVENEEQWTAQVAYYVDDHLDNFVTISK